MPSGIYDLEELRKWGKERQWCPYYLTRQAINHANVLVYNYQYMLDPKVAKMVSKELESESIIVFDEAHNIDSVCIEALSVTINDRGLEQATRSLGRLSSEVSRIKKSDNQRLQQEYQSLVSGLIDQGLLQESTNNAGLASVSSPFLVLLLYSNPHIVLTLLFPCFRTHWLQTCSTKLFLVTFAEPSISLDLCERL
jgi:DNA excision repair protein ERCC-2